MNINRVVAGGVSLALLAVMSGCGGSSPTSAPITQTQALSVTDDVFVAMADALESSGAPLVSGSAGEARAKTEAAGIRGALLNGSQTAPAVQDALNGLNANIALPRTSFAAFTYDCPSGGTIVVSGSYSATGTSSTAQVVELINKCNDGVITMNGNPNVTLTDNASLSGNIYSDVATLTGGITAGSSSCVINVTISATVNDVTYAESGSISGSICGVSVNGTL